ncbi:type IV toxin-antitoxin system AbiEi family antitoxin domain-containing protein [Algoriphagus sp. H41]|uniref:Type IV toxin-antitoxin system AbiEi family antitoxin domain-containing protein n=1 Tax=Algoriphagus oliviformis TaxID=2811231 RepID=A0ABS3C352_9BACT|nr:DUF6088 family protein [Algoriphagus oliviformis]MBN7811506.1 type IV toxin-antitoxin system AbiEi family antitoxin domain-containing protein [Algoriphagus oliviformis]
MEATEEKISHQIKAKPRGSLFFPEDFKSCGSDEAVRVALHRMVKNGALDRIAQGIYTLPKHSDLIGKVYPSIEEVAQAIAKRDRARIIPTGVYALNALGLSTQVPTKAVYLTDGAARLVKVGNRTILFKRTSPKNLSVKGSLSGLAIQALKSIGKDQVIDTEIEKILFILQKEDSSNLEHDKSLAPAWISKIFDQALKKKQYVR